MRRLLFKTWLALRIWLCGLCVRVGNSPLTGPALFHPESVETDLSTAEEDLLAAIDAELWPRRARSWRLGATYTFGSGNGTGV